MDDHTGIHRASEELLAGMGVALTDRARTELGTAAARRTRDAEVALAQGINAQRRGTVVEALSRYIQAAQHNPALAEATSRLNVLAASVSSGNIREDVGNEIRWRNEWLDTIRQTNEFFQSYVSQPPPMNLVYTTDIRQGNIDFNAGTVNLVGITVALEPDLSWFDTVNRVLQTVNAGLRATQRAQRWGISWPREDGGWRQVVRYSSRYLGMPFVDNYNGIWVTVEVVNDEGRSLGSRTIAMPYGWRVYEHTENDFRRGRVPTGQVSLVPIAVGPTPFTIYRVNHEHITPNLSVRIAAINGVPTAQFAVQRNISVMTEADARAARINRPGNATSAVDIFQLHRALLDDAEFRRGSFRIRLHGAIGDRERSLNSVQHNQEVHIISPTVTSVHLGGLSCISRVVLPPSVRNIQQLQGLHGGQYVIHSGVNISPANLPNVPASRPRLHTYYNNNGRRPGIYVKQIRGVDRDAQHRWVHIPLQLQ